MHRLAAALTGAKDLNTLTAHERAVLRPMSDLFRILARPSVSAAALEHCEAVYGGLPPPRARGSRLERSARAALLMAIADGYRRLGLTAGQAVVSARAKADARVSLRNSRSLLCLEGSLGITWMPTIDHRDVVPVIWAMLSEWRRLSFPTVDALTRAIMTAGSLTSNPLIDAIVEFAERARPGSADRMLEVCFARARRPLGAGWQNAMGTGGIEHRRGDASPVAA